MVFTSSVFILFYVLFFPIYWWVNNHLGIKWRNFILVLASYIFYGWWDYRFLGLIALSSLTDYLVGRLIWKSKTRNTRLFWLVLSIVINIGILAYFKYANFFLDSLNHGLEAFSISIQIETLKVILPVGISFYTFQTLSYTIDIYRKKLQPTNRVLSFFAFVAFFPQLVAGPIERASNLLPQFFQKHHFNYQLVVGGARLILWGFFKKLVVADNLAFFSDALFDPSLEASFYVSFIASLSFGLQIYFDFSAYSDIAIGLSRMLGFNLMKNFNTPYLAKSFREFWQRWHISLSSWFRDYVYLPLGGNQSGSARTYLNLFITFLISGLWHGANVTFLLWGGLHALASILERLFLKPSKTSHMFHFNTILVFLVVMLLWIPFRAESLGHTMQLYSGLFHYVRPSDLQLSLLIYEFSQLKFIWLLLILMMVGMIEIRMNTKDFNEWISSKKSLVRILIYYGLVIAILFLANFNAKPNFIYFQF